MWGITYALGVNDGGDTRDLVSLPRPRIEKLAHEVANPCFDYGSKQMPLLQVQRLTGLAQSCAPVVPSLTLEIRPLYDLIAGSDGSLALPPSAKWGGGPVGGGVGGLRVRQAPG